MFNLKAKSVNYEFIIREWLKTKEGIMSSGEIKYQSYVKYLYVTEKYIIPKLGDVCFSKLNNKMIDEFFNNAEISNKALSSQKLFFYIINSSIKYGISNNYKTGIKTIDVRIKTPKPKLVYLTKVEQKKLENLLFKKKGLKSLGILLCLYTGIRIGELCALRWGDIDFNRKCYYIEHTVLRVKCDDYYNKTKLIVGNPKTFSSRRIVPLPDFLIPILKRYKTDDNIFIFSCKDSPRDPRTFEAYFERLLVKAKIDKINFHALRHTFATRSLEAGMDIKTLSEILGHSSYRVTLDIYVHSSFDLKKDSLNGLVNYLNKGRKNFN